MSVTVTYASTVTVVETLETNVDSSATGSARQITHQEFNESGTYTSSTTPPVTKCAHFIATLSSGTLTIDFTALTGTNGASVTASGLKLQIMRVKNLGANTLNIAPGASNGYAPWGASNDLTIASGDHMQWFFNDTLADVSGSTKTLDLSGTGTQTSEWTLIFG